MSAKLGKQSSGRRIRERRKYLSMVFDLYGLGMLLLTLVCVAISWKNCQTCGVTAPSASGFAAWVLMVIGYVPAMIACVFCFFFGIPLELTPAANALFLGGCCVVFEVACWVMVRLIARTRPIGFIQAAGHFCMIFFYWALMQLFFYGTAVAWGRGEMADAMTIPEIVSAAPAGGNNSGK
ncbi:MAG: hypothetical protein MJ025_00785 [Victivallaceae bacterium]|nr:hypothetical protein [Victivallaceae bacterium]